MSDEILNVPMPRYNAVMIAKGGYKYWNEEVVDACREALGWCEHNYLLTSCQICRKQPQTVSVELPEEDWARIVARLDRAVSDTQTRDRLIAAISEQVDAAAKRALEAEQPQQPECSCGPCSFIYNTEALKPKCGLTLEQHERITMHNFVHAADCPRHGRTT